MREGKPTKPERKKTMFKGIIFKTNNYPHFQKITETFSTLADAESWLDKMENQLDSMMKAGLLQTWNGEVIELF